MIKKNLELWKSILPLYDGPYWEKERIETQEFINKLEQELKNPEKEKFYSVKNYLLKHSRLVRLNNKIDQEIILDQTEETQENRILNLRCVTFANIHRELLEYYKTTIEGRDYQIPRIIYDWLGEKIWQLLFTIGEPNHPYYQKTLKKDYWTEAGVK